MVLMLRHLVFKMLDAKLSRREDWAGGWRRLHNEKLHKLEASPNIIQVMKSRRMR
jgi:hypothetical protein